MCAVLCRLVASARCQRRCALAVRVSGFNWAFVVVKVHAGRQCAVRLLCGGAVQRSRCGYALCGGLLCYAHYRAFRNGLQVLLEHNILCFSAENSAFSPVRTQYVVVEKKISGIAQKVAQNNRYFFIHFCAYFTHSRKTL